MARSRRGFLSSFRRQDWHGDVVVITGGSRGLGIELAREWLARGARVAICARTSTDVERAVELLETQGPVMGRVCDVGKVKQVQQFLADVIAHFGRLDVLVNNAGQIQVGPAACMRRDDYRSAMDCHFWGPYEMVEAALPYLRQSEHPRIVNIASIGGEISVPHLLPYSASKFALVGYSQGLRTELLPEGIRVTTVCPGLMRTGSPRNASFKGDHRKEYAWFSIGDSLPLITISSHAAARRILRAAWRGRAYLSFTPTAILGIRLHGLFPGLSAHVLGLVNRLLPTTDIPSPVAKTGVESFSQWSPSSLTHLTEQAALRNNEVREVAPVSVVD